MRPDADGGALARATADVVARLGRRGVRLSGHETGDQLIDLLDAVERFEAMAERRGADLLVDEPVPGASAPIAPDDPDFALPARRNGEAVADFLGRLAEATARAGHVHHGARGAHGGHGAHGVDGERGARSDPAAPPGTP